MDNEQTPQPDDRKCVGRFTEPPGSYRWPVYDLVCPRCGLRMIDFREAERPISGSWEFVCPACNATGRK